MTTGRFFTSGLGILFVTLWSSGWVGSKYGLEYTGVFTLLAWRYVVMSVILAALVVLLGHWRKLGVYELLCHIVIGILCHAVYLSACLHPLTMGVSAGVIAFFASLLPLFTAVASAFLMGDKISGRQWRGLALGLASVILVIGNKISLGGSISAYGLLVLAVTALCLGVIMNQRLGMRNRSQGRMPAPLLQILFIHALSSTVLLVPFAGITEGFEAQWNSSLVVSIGWLAIAVSLSGYGLMFLLLRRLPVVKMSCLTYLIPPTTMLIGYVAFNETLAPADVTGLALAAFAIWTITRTGSIDLSAIVTTTPDIDLDDSRIKI